MPSDTRNVKLGACRLFYNNVDLGYTKGGVEVEVTTDTHAVTIDQFGETEVDEFIQKRTIVVRAPLAETTLENMVAIMPGASMIDNSTTQQNSVDITVVSATASQTDTITIDGVDYSFASDADPTEGEIALGLVDVINADANCPMTASTTALAGDTTAQVVLDGKVGGVSSTIAVSANLNLTSTVVAEEGAKRVIVKTGIGTSLLDIAKELRLHPKALAASDQSEDMVIPLAATAGAINFAYRHNEERVYNVEFRGYPNSTSEELFAFGDPAAV